MRLLDVRTITLETFTSEYEVPRYAILSHTWGPEEVTLDDLEGGNPGQRHGYWKIKTACQETRRAGINYLWVDTCCIDKSSSSELSEAINSMFKWYEAASTCYAYLEDVEASGVDNFQHTPMSLDITSDQEAEILRSQFAKSRWWTRGWTLQELIAPDVLIFYDKAFQRIGSKEDFVRVVSLVSSIDETILLNKVSLKDVCVATKMSWAAKRRTTRIEDEAYCLLGIFDINMAMLYGEGDRAFVRLQEEIIKATNDQSIFAWTGYQFENGSLFAPRPSCFKNMYRIRPLYRGNNNTEFTLTNAGLDIRLLLWESNKEFRKDTPGSPYCRRSLVAPLACRYEMDFSGPIALELEETEEKGTYVLHRKPERLLVFQNRAGFRLLGAKSILIRRHYHAPRIQASEIFFNKKCVVRCDDHPNYFRNSYCYPADSWSHNREVFWLKRSVDIMGALQLLTWHEWNIILIIGYVRKDRDTTAPTWAQEWITLEKIKGGTALQAHCENYRRAKSDPEKQSKIQKLDLAGIYIQASISSCEILEEDVFLVEIDVQESVSLDGQFTLVNCVSTLGNKNGNISTNTCSI
jgi:hypothetical protein